MRRFSSLYGASGVPFLPVRSNLTPIQRKQRSTGCYFFNKSSRSICVQSSKLYYPSGALYADITEKERKYFYEDGTEKTFEPYLAGKLHGIAVLYWPNRKLKRKSC